MALIDKLFGKKKTLSELNKMELRIRQAIDKLQEYRAALITAAVTGRIDVREQTKAAA